MKNEVEVLSVELVFVRDVVFGFVDFFKNEVRIWLLLYVFIVVFVILVFLFI